jgi:hypothetical protein
LQLRRLAGGRQPPGWPTRPDAPSWRAKSRASLEASRGDGAGDTVRVEIVVSVVPRMRAVRGFVLFTASRMNHLNRDSPDRAGTVTLEVTSALNLESTIVSGYLKYGW